VPQRITSAINAKIIGDAKAVALGPGELLVGHSNKTAKTTELRDYAGKPSFFSA